MNTSYGVQSGGFTLIKDLCFPLISPLTEAAVLHCYPPSPSTSSSQFLCFLQWNPRKQNMIRITIRIRIKITLFELESLYIFSFHLFWLVWEISQVVVDSSIVLPSQLLHTGTCMVAAFDLVVPKVLEILFLFSLLTTLKC